MIDFVSLGQSTIRFVGPIFNSGLHKPNNGYQDIHKVEQIIKQKNHREILMVLKDGVLA
ncbi:MAG TPA: hypothetical protein PK055_05445 [Gammaproteobacteria bacterium]|nr:hypothetical protein [Xanthomonadales bacterium]MCB1595761.1 hypothetical protein [Xanthomonadales bacterium]HPI95839.1 hypothetical protein [Gammaproteobacteria bacterium]HPQ87081.1 hypothetical protein [Gammaproteobacteria bacterium]